MSAEEYRFKPVTAESWGEFEELFQSRGSPSFCWCMVWRATPEESGRTDGASRKAFMKERIDRGTPVGILAYHHGRPIAWCSIAPKSTYRRLTKADRSTGDERVWSIACFFVRREHRNQGLTRRLIRAAVDYARRSGARTVEAYPVDADSPSYRFMGYVNTFGALGFREAGRTGKRRHIMSLDLQAAGGADETR